MRPHFVAATMDRSHVCFQASESTGVCLCVRAAYRTLSTQLVAECVLK